MSTMSEQLDELMREPVVSDERLSEILFVDLTNSNSAKTIRARARKLG